jgi:hypothetical protein
MDRVRTSSIVLTLTRFLRQRGTKSIIRRKRAQLRRALARETLLQKELQQTALLVKELEQELRMQEHRQTETLEQELWVTEQQTPPPVTALGWLQTEQMTAYPLELPSSRVPE